MKKKYLVQIKDLEHVLQTLLFDDVGLAVLVTKERSAQSCEINCRHQTIAIEMKKN